MNDASCLDRTSVVGIVEPRTEREVADALSYARGAGLPISPAGMRHSMGGHAFRKGGIMLDMRRLNQIQLHPNTSTITVEAGATWDEIQKAIHPSFAVKAMQSTDIFTVGGSISVNAHGMDHRAGAIMNSVNSLRIMLADGRIVEASRRQNPDLFRLAVGGYGLFGIILSAELQVVPNDIYASQRQLVSAGELPSRMDQLAVDPSVRLLYAHLSTAPESLLQEALIYNYRRTDTNKSVSHDLPNVGWVKSRRLMINLARRYPSFQSFKWWSEKNLERGFESCAVTRSEAVRSGEACLVSRNEPMHDSVSYLKNGLAHDTGILQEYFVPQDQLLSFIEGVRQIVRKERANLLNASVRMVGAEDNVLTYARQPAFSLALYFSQRTDADGNSRMKVLTRELIDLALAHGGRFFLPYQLHYSADQLEQAYPEIRAFVAQKRKWDPEERFSNTWYEQYGKRL